MRLDLLDEDALRPDGVGQHPRALTLEGGLDLLKAPEVIYAEAEKMGVKVKYDTISLINRLRDANPDRFRGRQVRDDVEVYINQDGDLYFG